MKVVLTGATGFVGGEVLSELIAEPRVTQITCLGRRPPDTRHPKVVALVHADFSRYEAGTLERLRGHSACIWALGGKAADVRDPRVHERVTHGYTLAFAEVMARFERAPFSFCYLSGMGADPSESSWFPWEKRTRHLKGRTERDLVALTLAARHWSVFCFRPAGILPRGSSPWLERALAPIVIRVNDLARALVRAATDPASAPASPLGNRVIKRWALELGQQRWQE